MYARERPRRILELLEGSGRVTVTDLAADFEVPTETVRRDRDQLAAARALDRRSACSASSTWRDSSPRRTGLPSSIR